jgi:two-component system chemotaxis response regulator CheY
MEDIIKASQQVLENNINNSINNEMSDKIMELAYSIWNSPNSWQDWFCIYVGKCNDMNGCGNSMTLVQFICDYLSGSSMTTISNGEETIVMCKHIDRANLYALISSHNLRERDLQVFRVSEQWRELFKFLLQLSESIKVDEKAVEYSCAGETIFSEIDEFQEVIDKNIAKRSTRDNLNIMLVDDDMLTCKLVGRLLPYEHNFIIAQDAYEAVASYVLYAPDVVILDINLPDFDGYDILNRIVRSDKDAYVVMFSGDCGVENITAATSYGAKGFIAKPFRREHIMEHINLVSQFKKKSGCSYQQCI